MLNRIWLPVLLALCCQLTGATTLRNLRVEYLPTPLAIDVAQPRFSWQMESAQRATMQTAYRITVKDDQGQQVWDSGKQMSAVALNILYQGQALHPQTRYNWSLTVWDNHGRKVNAASWFETSLMSTSDRDAAWHGAQWIGGTEANSLTFCRLYLPVFRLRFSITLDEASHSREAALIYGANDPRLMDRNKNILNMESPAGNSYIKVAINSRGLDHGDSAHVEVYRVGYTTTDRPDRPFASIAIPASIFNKTNRYKRHYFELTSLNGTTTLWIDHHDKPVVSNLNLNPMGTSGNVISFPMVGDMGYSVPQGNKARFTDVEVLNFRLPRHTLSRLDDASLSGKTVFFSPKETGAPRLRTAFALQKPIVQARLYVTARGTYEMFINGQRVGNDYLNPGLTQYNRTLLYQTYDVTQLLRKGRNAMGAQLNEGWWSGAVTYFCGNWNFFGDRQSLMAMLTVTYTDGTQQVVTTQPDSWRLSTEGPVRLGSIFQGEVYDATREVQMTGWSMPDFDDSRWLPASVVPLEGCVSHEQSDDIIHWPCPDDYSHFTLRSQAAQPIRAFTTLTAQSMKEVRPGVYVYDMGQNMAGVPSIRFSGLSHGQQVTLRYAEMCYPDLPEHQGQVGMVMMENQRSALEQDVYIARGGEETFHPRATYHGYRYVEITGINRPLPLEDVKGVVLSSVDSLTAAYETNDARLNRFFCNVEWSTLANIMSVPTDCPQRNERMGWSGDLSVFAPALSYLFNAAPFLRQHLQALRDTQFGDGTFAYIAPIGGGFGGPLWSSVGIVLPWQTYQQYGDREALSEHYAAMKRYMELQLQHFIDSTQQYYKGSGAAIPDLGDWLGMEVQKNDNSLLLDCYLCYELQIMDEVARLLGYADDAERYNKELNKRKAFINDHYFDPLTGKTTGTGFGSQRPTIFGLDGPKPKGQLIDTQTSYALPIAFGIISESLKAKAEANLANSVCRQSQSDKGETYPPYSLMTGFIGTAWIAPALTQAGRSDLAYRMLLNDRFPSWLYPVEQGATTIWERLNSYTRDKGFGGNNGMNSFNHYAFGSVAAWLMQSSLGIQSDPEHPGFSHFILRPQPDTTGKLTFARGHYDSMYGRIESSWERRDGKVVYRFTLPANTTATLYLPGQQPKEITSGTHQFEM